MTFKSFRPARPAVKALCLLWLCGVGIGALRGQAPQDPNASPSATPKPKFGYLRFWNLLPLTTSGLELAGASDPAGRGLLSARPGTFPSNYRLLPPARYTLTVYPFGDRLKPLNKTPMDVPLRADAYMTVVVRPSADPGGEAVVELVDDTLDPTQAADNRLTVYQCSPEARVVVTAARNFKSNPLVYGGTQTLTALPDGIVGLAISIATKAGPGAWNTEADFRASARASLVVVADPYGRIRPRITVDGASRNGAVPDAPNRPNATPSPPLSR